MIERVKNKLIENIEKWQESLSPQTDLRDRVIWDTLESVIETIANFDEDELWIPCSEKLPYEGGKYMKSVLATMEDYQGGRFVTDTLDRRVTKENKVVAWTPLPNTYMGNK